MRARARSASTWCFRGRPRCRPWARARLTPAITRSRMRSRSNAAIAVTAHRDRYAARSPSIRSIFPRRSRPSSAADRRPDGSRRRHSPRDLRPRLLQLALKVGVPSLEVLLLLLEASHLAAHPTELGAQGVDAGDIVELRSGSAHAFLGTGIFQGAGECFRLRVPAPRTRIVKHRVVALVSLKGRPAHRRPAFGTVLRSRHPSPAVDTGQFHQPARLIFSRSRSAAVSVAFITGRVTSSRRTSRIERIRRWTRSQGYQKRSLVTLIPEAVCHRHSLV